MNPIASFSGADPHEWRYGHDDPGIVECRSVSACRLLCSSSAKGKEFFRRNISYALRIGIWIVPHYLSGIILNQGDRIMIDKMVGKTEVALYGLAYALVCWCSFHQWYEQCIDTVDVQQDQKGDIRSMCGRCCSFLVL